MKAFMHTFLTLIASLLLMNTSFAGDTPAGLWKSFVDKGKPTGYVRVLDENGVYKGIIEKGLETDKEDKYCTACKDERKGQRLIGMT